MMIGLRLGVFSVLLMAIPLGAWWFVFRPQNEANAEMLKQIEVKRAKLRQLNTATGTIGDLQKEIASLRKAVDFFQSKLPNEKEIDKVLQDIWKLAESNKLITKSIRPIERSTSSDFNSDISHAEQPIAVQLEGDFIGFYTFLLALENQPRIMRISQMVLRKVDKGPAGYVRAEFTISIFFESGQDKICLSTK